MDTSLLVITGLVKRVVYRNEENGYAVLTVDLPANEKGKTERTSVVGTIPFAMAGERCNFSGKWIMHPTYGSQFEAAVCEIIPPETEDEILDYLTSGAIPGLGPASAVTLVGLYGAETLAILAEDPQRLTEVKSVTLSKAMEWNAQYLAKKAMRRLTEFFTANGLSLKYALRLYRSFGEDWHAAITDNPYLLTADDFGASFREADGFALSLGFDPAGSERLCAAILFELSYNANSGHSFVPADKLLQATAGLLSGFGELLGDALEALADSGDVAICDIAGEHACYLKNLRDAEVTVAERLRILSEKSVISSYDTEKLWGEFESEEFTLAPEQKNAVREAAAHGAFALTGGPGTGKTTTLKVMLTLFDRMGLKTALAAPTGRAAKRMSELTDRAATTIHRLLEVEYDKTTGQMGFKHNEQTPLAADVVILDETSMVDVELMSALLKSLKDKARLILVGDADQLPSVGPGNVLSDILRSGIVPSVRLETVFRQANASLIIRNAHSINHGNMPEQGQKSDDFFVMPRPNSVSAAELITSLCKERLPDKMGIAANQIQVLSPTRKGIAGTRDLNIKLQSVLNPAARDKNETTFGTTTFREGDRVMQIRNNYELLWSKGDEVGQGVFNGDVGTVIEINPKLQNLTVDYEDRSATYSFDMLGELEPAFAMTVHKSQGSEYRAVILSLMDVPKPLLTKSILYTAVTRARELLIIVGNPNEMAAMVANDKPRKRYSGLRARLAGE
ncbi:MAG: ATP-dependent RecD-like DNA helicase [Oscillospiraceae bacterium]|jgi:exodeoxyribonuclease V alpha subunit|nr:ATP-dependent RecD-like DNA helicase [Oscillospiraceae bacterium]